MLIPLEGVLVTMLTVPFGAVAEIFPVALLVKTPAELMKTP